MATRGSSAPPRSQAAAGRVPHGHVEPTTAAAAAEGAAPAAAASRWSSARPTGEAAAAPAGVASAAVAATAAAPAGPSPVELVAQFRSSKSPHWVPYNEVARLGDCFERHAGGASSGAVRPYSSLAMDAAGLPKLLDAFFFSFDAPTLRMLTVVLIEDTLAIATTAAAAAAVSGSKGKADGGASPSLVSFPVFIDWFPTMELLQRRQGAVPKSAPSAIDWAHLRQQLPYGLSTAEEKRRESLFTRCDPNGNGFLSLAEIDKALRDELRISQIFDCKPVIMRAFQAARGSVPASERNHNGDYVTRATFRVLLYYLKEYFELWQIFVAADVSGDRRIDKGEFGNIFVQLKSSWGLKVTSDVSADKVFQQMDTNNGGVVLFDEFAHWALLQNLSAD